jgi:hypothetical protein
MHYESFCVQSHTTKLPNYTRDQHLTRKVRLAGTWISEKSFAATPYLCHDKMLDLHIIMPRSVDNFIMAS